MCSRVGRRGTPGVAPSPLPGSECRTSVAASTRSTSSGPTSSRLLQPPRDGLGGVPTWVRNSGRARSRSLRADPDRPPQRRPRSAALVRGVNIIGYFTAELGVGEGGRAHARHAGPARRAVRRRQRGRAHRTGSSTRSDRRSDPRTSTSTSCASTATRCHGSWSAWRRVCGRSVHGWHVGMGAGGVPAGMHGGVPYVDEIWTNSRHAGGPSAGRSTCLSVVVPLPVLRYAIDRHEGGTAPHRRRIHVPVLLRLPQHPSSARTRRRRPGVPSGIPSRPRDQRWSSSRSTASPTTAFEQLRSAADGRSDIRLVDAYLDVAATEP